MPACFGTQISFQDISSPFCVEGLQTYHLLKKASQSKHSKPNLKSTSPRITFSKGWISEEECVCARTTCAPTHILLFLHWLEITAVVTCEISKPYCEFTFFCIGGTENETLPGVPTYSNNLHRTTLRKVLLHIRKNRCSTKMRTSKTIYHLECLSHCDLSCGEGFRNLHVILGDVWNGLIYFLCSTEHIISFNL